MDESIKNYRKGELNNLDGDYLGHYKIKVIGADTETKWLNIDQSELDRIAGVLTDDETAEVSRALSTLRGYGYAVQVYGPDDVHEALTSYAEDDADPVDTLTYRDEITRHIMEGDDWSGLSDKGTDAVEHLYNMIGGTHHDHPEWFPEAEPETALDEEPTPDLVAEYTEIYSRLDRFAGISMGQMEQYGDRMDLISAELRKRGVIN